MADHILARLWFPFSFGSGCMRRKRCHDSGFSLNGVVDGNIHVGRLAQKTDARQLSRSLLAVAVAYRCRTVHPSRYNTAV
jgi:hypothetical protein